MGHAVRGVVSLLILKYLPRTSTIIQNLENFEREKMNLFNENYCLNYEEEQFSSFLGNIKIYNF